MSTPIETNTEQLQEVLQQVYNLPNRSGGSAWDCVITSDWRPWYSDSQNAPFYVESGSLLSVWEKGNRGEKPNVLFRYLGEYEGDYFHYFCEASHVYCFGYGVEDGECADTPARLQIDFFADGEYLKLESTSQADITSNTITTYTAKKLI